MRIMLIGFLCLVQQGFAQFVDYNVTKEIQTKAKSVVVSAHPLASEAGAAVMRKGGNAFDAAIATQYALAVVYPQAGNIGGGGFLIAVKADGKKLAIDFRETAPAKAHRNMYLDKKGKADTDLSQNGRLAVGVPGSVAGCYETLKYARLPMEELLQPAIDLAEKGFAITEKEAKLLNETKEDFLRHNKTPIVFVKDTPWKAGDVLVQKELAETLKRIQKFGEKEFYEGKTAQMIVAEMKKGNGILGLKDLKNYQIKKRTPLSFDYKGYEVVTMPLPSSGGVLLAQMLKMSAYENLSQYQYASPEAVQIMVEAERRAYADRAEYMGDPDFIEDRTPWLISDDYLKERWASFSFSQATPSAQVGRILSPTEESPQTTHLSILDKEGNAVSVTTTLNGYYGSKVVVAGAGFFLNNEMDDFSIKPGVPNLFGAVGGEANAIQPGKRMLSSMTPSILLKDQRPAIVVGTPGGTTIPTSVFQAIVNIVDFGLSPNLAVNLPKFHHQWLPETVAVEKNFSHDTRKALAQKGYVFKERGPIGKTEIIAIDDQGHITAVADSRGDDSVAVE